jgi:hypothetical protein
MAAALAGQPGVAVLNEVVLNQVPVRFDHSDERTRAVISGVQRDGTCRVGGTIWHGVAAMRISVSGYATSDADCRPVGRGDNPRTRACRRRLLPHVKPFRIS